MKEQGKTNLKLVEDVKGTETEILLYSICEERDMKNETQSGAKLWGVWSLYTLIKKLSGKARLTWREGYSELDMRRKHTNWQEPTI